MGSLRTHTACAVIVASILATAPRAHASADPVLRWNAIALTAVAEDHSGTFGPPTQGGPTRTARALAMVHAAIYDAVNSIVRSHEPYLTLAPMGRNGDASIPLAVAAAVSEVLAALYPPQAPVFAAALDADLAQVRHGDTRALALALGRTIARRLLRARTDDGSAIDPLYVAGTLPGEHRPDPINPEQGFLTPGWGHLLPFAIERGDQFRAPPPPALVSDEYADAFNEVKRLGGDGIHTPTERTADQTTIGLYWAYDGARHIGPPPRLYNQIVRLIAEQMGNTVVENARLFALVNLAMADAGIACWESKYTYNFWRPILGVREADPGTGPSGLGDRNSATQADPTWIPLCAPASNQSGRDFTPPFPAYPSGHATFGAATFHMLALFYGTDQVPFTFTSDELNGITTDQFGTVRPDAPRTFARLSDAAVENAISRIYLGIHWRFDATAGLQMGTDIADYVFAHRLRPVE